MYTHCLSSPSNQTKQVEFALNQAVSLLQSGQVVSFPTKTVYGLGCSMVSEKGIKEIFSLKDRDKTKPLTLLISSINQINYIAEHIPPEFNLLRPFFPGSLTVIFKRHPRISSVITGEMDTVALRMPAHPLLLKLITLTGCPLATTSANTSGRLSATSALHVFEDFNGKIPMILDGGECEHGMESTVLDFTDPSHPRILREGLVSKEELFRVLGRPIRVMPVEKRKLDQGAVRLFNSWNEVFAYLQMSVDDKRLVLSSGPKPNLPIEINHGSVNMNRCYRVLRSAFKDGYREVLVVCDDKIKRQPTLMNRLVQVASI